MYVVLVGGGEVGYALTRALAQSHDVVVIDQDPSVAERFSALDVDFVPGSGTSAAVLQRARMDQCDLLVACTGLDEVNIVACTIANRLGSPKTICFVSRDDFLRGDGDAESLHEHFGIDRVLWPEAQLAADIERIIAAPGAIDAESFAEGRIRLLEYRLEPGSALLRGPVSALNLPRGSLFVALKRGETIAIPRGGTHLQAGDKIIIMGTPEAMAEVQARVLGQRADRAGRARSVTIIGGGDVGFRLALRLDAMPGLELRVIERDVQRGALLAARLKRALVLNGDGTDLELLEQEEIGRSDVLVSVIDNDERNLLASLLGRQLGVQQIITRVGKPANLRLFERVGIDVALSAKGAAVASVLHQIEGGSANLLAVLEEGQAKILEIEVPATFTPVLVRDMVAPPESIVGAVLRGPLAIVPRGDDRIEPGDHLLVFATAASADSVRDYFTSAA
jgi:trk system potassium uptake protein TrkA